MLYFVFVLFSIFFSVLISLSCFASSDCSTLSLTSIEDYINSNCSGIVGSLTLVNTNYTSLQGLESLQQVQNLLISNNFYLINITLPEYNTPKSTSNYSLTITLNQNLQNINFPSFVNLEKSIVAVVISNNPSLVVLLLNNLIYLGLDNDLVQTAQLMVENNPNLSDLKLLSLQQGSIAFVSNFLLKNLSFPSLTRLTGFELDNNQNLEVLNFTALICASQNFFVTNNANLLVLAFPELNTASNSYFLIQDNARLNSFQIPLVKTLSTIEIVNSPQLDKVEFPSLLSLSFLQIENNAMLTNLSMPFVSTCITVQLVKNPVLVSILFQSLVTVDTLVLENIGIESLLTITGSLVTSSTIVLKDLPSLLSLYGLAVTSTGLSINNLPLITSLQGLILQSIPQFQFFNITNNPALNSLSGLDDLRIIQGQMVIQNNPVLTDYFALSGVALLFYPVVLIQCCPAFEFFTPSSLFNRSSNFNCSVCAEFGTPEPSTGPVTGGTYLLIPVTRTVPSSQLYFRFGSEITLCNYAVLSLGYICITPPSANFEEESVELYISFDSGINFFPIQQSFVYSSWTSILGFDLFRDYNASKIDSGSYSTELVANSSVDGLPALPASRTAYANTVADFIVIAGGSTAALIFISLSAIYFLSDSGHDLLGKLSHYDYIRVRFRSDSSPPNDTESFFVLTLASKLGGLITITAYITVITVVTAYLSQTFLDFDYISTSLSPANTRTVKPSQFTAELRLNLYNDSCVCNENTLASSNSSPLSFEITGFQPAGNYTCNSIENNIYSNRLDCLISWNCPSCSQIGLLSSLALTSNNPNLVFPSFNWSFTVQSYLQTALKASGNCSAVFGTVFKGNNPITQIPLAITPASYTRYSDEPLLGRSIDVGVILLGEQQNPTSSYFGTDGGFTIELNSQQNIVWIDVIITSKYTNIAILAQVAAIATGVLSSAGILLSSMKKFSRTFQLQPKRVADKNPNNKIVQLTAESEDRQNSI